MEGYVLKINFMTDGDFSCSKKYLTHDGGYTYTLFKMYDKDHPDVLGDAIAILTEIRESISTSKSHVKERVSTLITNAIAGITNNCEFCDSIYGNQECEIFFDYVVTEEKNQFILSLNQEEYENLLLQVGWVDNKLIDITNIND